MNITLSPLFSDGMVLQRGKKIKVQGTASPNNDVIMRFLDKSYNMRSDSGGHWQCLLDESSAGGPYELTVEAGGDELVIKDILVGDVWLCGGQSNMELMLNRTKNMYPEEMTFSYPEIRQFKVPQVYNFHEPSELTDGKWESYSPDTAENFTAAGYFFAKKLYEKYKVPIGLLAAAVGGTPIQAWMGREMLADFPEALAEADKYKDDAYIEKLAADYREYSEKYFGELYAADEGIKNNWNSADFDDGGWAEKPLCTPTGGLGVYWYRKTIDAPEKLWGKKATFFFGTAIDSLDVYINGEKLGNTAYRYPPCEFDFTIPEGRAVIAVRLVCLGKKGGFIRGKNRFIACDNHSIRLDGLWKQKKGTSAEPFSGEVFVRNMPTGLFNGMISPLTGFPINGVIWYQGESDGGNAERYGEKFKIMINGWRECWGSDFPFIFTEIAHWGEACEDDWDNLRSKQRDALELPNTAMAAAFDLGETNDLHPQSKKDIGERLARLAMRIAYNETLPNSCFEMCGFAPDNL